ncbi:MAG: nitroreductase family deazaflavin-dependent oxidoreductase [Roseiflexus sp.]|nr:nitroreductase family deazaflavin-dependent oxidoreductase [Roseiflexus sp.]MCS7289587.1 nitroreductase family deazaflavin-dependent oxidoreductase [Roseiflexus sp.]MDW8148624.1 nitroreductase family deazaflavin-dependent oxidoreductase [Roseiflexaceae bacterium]MDW8231728.1 nitroreductase family deazaflavin-dependent oxidoreductase [Roseiflexaceae bacterium]
MTKHHPLFVQLVKVATAAHVALYRLMRGALPHPLLGRHCLLLTTTGRRSGKKRVTPLLFVRDGGDYIVVGSWGGSDSPPQWYLNLRSDPRVVVEDHGYVTSAVAIEVDNPEEYERLWRRLVAIYPTYETYRQRTARRLPIVRLSPVSMPKMNRERRI